MSKPSGQPRWDRIATNSTISLLRLLGVLERHRLHTYDPQEQFPTFQRILSKSGHRTIRIILEKATVGNNASEVVLEQLVTLGCSYEGATNTYVCIDIPPGVELGALRHFMIQRSIQFEHADPTYGELFPDEET